LKNQTQIPIKSFKDIFDELPMPIHIWQKNEEKFIFRYFNDANDKLTNGNLEKFLGISASDLHKKEPELVENLRKCVQEKIKFTRKINYKFKSTVEEKYLIVTYFFVSPDLIVAMTEDKSKIKNKEETINHKSNLQNLISRISSRFVDITDLDDSINKTLAEIGKLSGASRSYIFVINYNKNIAYNTHEWCNKGVDPQIENLQNIPLDDIKWFLKNIKREKGVNIEDLSELPPEAVKVRKILQKQHIKSLLNYPLYMKDELIGFIGFDNTEDIGRWDQEDFDSLKITSEIIGNALERKQNEKFLKELNIELEKKVIKRTRELKKSEEKFREAFELANFYKNLIAHDMNNILQNIRSSMQLGIFQIEKEKDLQKLRELFDIINEQTIRGAKLVNNIRKISNIEKNNQKLYPLDICKYLKTTVKSVRDINKSRHLQININTEIKNRRVKANAFIEDLFENILINAIKYNDSSVVMININIQNENKDGKDYIKVEFEDNGIGIKDNRKSLIFEPEVKENKIRSGLGVGLSLVKKIINSFNGEIWVENRIKGDYTQGSKFILLFPKLE